MENRTDIFRQSQKNRIVFWFGVQPKVGKGAFNELTRIWPNEVIYVFFNDLNETRKQLNWNDDEFGNAKVIRLYENANPIESARRFFLENIDAVHFIQGLTSELSLLIRKLAVKYGAKLCASSERPLPLYTKSGFITDRIKIVWKNTYYRYLALRYKTVLKAFLPLGLYGVREYEKLGFQTQIMYPFMYCPEITGIDPKFQERTGKIKFLYIGRFQYSTKGLKYLQEACDSLPPKGWQLDMAGGYGVDRECILKWIESNPNVNFLGAWPAETVKERISGYDVVIVPSSGEGWNMVNHEAIMGGVGVITTDEATSDELIKYSGAGVVVKAYDSGNIREAMIGVINNPEIVDKWKLKAKMFQPQISPEAVAKYLMEIINYTFYGKENRKPNCPWLTQINEERTDA